MISFNVTNPTILRLLLEHVIETMEAEDGIDHLLHSGCSPEFLDALRRRQARDLINVANTLRTMRFSISSKEVMNQLNHLDRKRRDAELQEYFIKHGATNALLKEYFKMSADEVRRLRNLLLPKGTAQVGRAPLPPVKVRDQIHSSWSVINKQHVHEAMRNRLFRLHQQFPSYTVVTLNDTIKEFDEPIASVPALGECPA